MNPKQNFRGPSAMETAGVEDKEPVRAVANKEKEDERMVQGVAMPAVQKKCNCDSSEKPKASSAKNARFSNAFKTECDFKVHPDDQIKMFKGTPYSFRMVGTGKPKVVSLLSASQRARMGPCELKVYEAHEQVHVKNATANCAGFKSCIEAQYGFLSGAVSWNDYAACYTEHHAGLGTNCTTDEQEAYTVSAAEAARLATTAECAEEKVMMDQAVIQHKAHAANPPNCR